jgi:RimJ/RimL family protein N-acetyltransferase
MKSEVTLRNLNQGDYKNVRDYVCSPEVAKYLTWKAYTQEKDVKDYFSKALPKIACPDEVLGIEYQGKIIGTVHLLLRQDNFIQMGFGITPHLWGKGIGVQTLEVILNYIQNTEWSNMSKEIWADIHQDNIYAAKTLQKCGFILQKSGIELKRNRFILKIA